MPDPIADIDPEVTFEAAELAQLAEEATKKLNSGVDGAGLEAIGPLLLRSEAIASSRIEGYSATSFQRGKSATRP